MAVNPAGFEIKKIENLDEYLNELFNQGPEGLPSFYHFLEEMRGIPRETFTKEQLTLLALNSEMSYYTMFINSAFAQKKQTDEAARQRAEYIESLKGASLDELVAHANALKGEIERAKVAADQGIQGAAEAYASYIEQLLLVEAQITQAGQELGEAA